MFSTNISLFWEITNSWGFWGFIEGVVLSILGDIVFYPFIYVVEPSLVVFAFCNY